MSWVRRNLAWMSQVDLLMLIAGVVVYFLALQSLLATAVLIAVAISLSQGATSIVVSLQRRQLRRLFFVVRQSPREEIFRQELVARMRDLPHDEVANVLVRAVRGDGELRLNIEDVLARGEGSIDQRLAQVIDAVLSGR